MLRPEDAIAWLAIRAKSSSEATNLFPGSIAAPMFAPKWIQAAALERMLGLLSANA
jgi:hypothetical protein